MNEVRTLFEQFWICKDSSKEDYYKIKRDIPEFQRFVREQLGWKLIHTENLLKLEKIPAHAEVFMGIQEFVEILDYCILCVVLMYLEDKEEGEQFLLSELIDYVETKLKGEVLIDWTSFSQRKSLVRTLDMLNRAFADVKIIRNEYIRYNQYMLAKKAQSYLKKKEEVEGAQQEYDEKQNEKNVLRSELQNVAIHLEELSSEEKLAETEINGLLDTDLEEIDHKLQLAKKGKEQKKSMMKF